LAQHKSSVANTRTLDPFRFLIISVAGCNQRQLQAIMIAGASETDAFVSLTVHWQQPL